MQKFAHKLPKEDLKKFAKEIGKKLVASDFKHKRVEDPTKISEKQEKKVKKFVRDYFDKAVEKKKIMDAKKKEKDEWRRAKEASQTGETASHDGLCLDHSQDKEILDADEELEAEIDMSDAEIEVEASPSIPPTPAAAHANGFLSGTIGEKRKRGDSVEDTGLDSENSDVKRVKAMDEDLASSPPPPPPPPPPAEQNDPAADGDEGDALANAITASYDALADDTANQDKADETLMPEETEEQAEHRRQEEELVRENEEAAMWEERRAQSNGQSDSSLAKTAFINGATAMESVDLPRDKPMQDSIEEHALGIRNSQGEGMVH